jgi:hypothetical protein
MASEVSPDGDYSGYECEQKLWTSEMKSWWGRRLAFGPTLNSIRRQLSSSECVCGFSVCLPIQYCPASKGSDWIQDVKDPHACLAPYQGSTEESIDLMLNLAEFDKSKSILDIGAGDGRVLVRALQLGARFAAGWEIRENIYRIGEAHLDAALDPDVRSHGQLYLGDARTHCSFEDVDIVTMFLLPDGLRIMNSILTETLCRLPSKQTRYPVFVSAGWPLPGWKVIKTATTSGGTPVFRMEPLNK